MVDRYWKNRMVELFLPLQYTDPSFGDPFRLLTPKERRLALMVLFETITESDGVKDWSLCPFGRFTHQTAEAFKEIGATEIYSLLTEWAAAVGVPLRDFDNASEAIERIPSEVYFLFDARLADCFEGPHAPHRLAVEWMEREAAT